MQIHVPSTSIAESGQLGVMRLDPSSFSSKISTMQIAMRVSLLGKRSWMNWITLTQIAPKNQG